MKFHRLARYFPVLEGEDFDLLVESIRKNGQREPIITHEGQILDGINRYRACEKLGIEPEYRELPEDADPLQYVVDMNIRRRHMDVSQRAMLATEMLPEFETKAEKVRLANLKQNEGSPNRSGDRHGKTPESETSRGMTAKVFGVSGPSIQRAKRVKEDAPDRVADIVSGKTTVTAVDAELRHKSAADRAAERKEQQTEKTVKEHPKAVKEHLEAIREYRDALKLAIEVRKRDLYSPEAVQMVMTKNQQIRSLMDEWEGIR